MATLIVRKLDDSIRDRLRIRAALHGVSMEAEVRKILLASIESDPPPGHELNLAERIRLRFAPFGGVDLELPPRELGREPPIFD